MSYQFIFLNQFVQFDINTTFCQYAHEAAKDVDAHKVFASASICHAHGWIVIVHVEPTHLDIVTSAHAHSITGDTRFIVILTAPLLTCIISSHIVSVLVAVIILKFWFGIFLQLDQVVADVEFLSNLILLLFQSSVVVYW